MVVYVWLWLWLWLGIRAGPGGFEKAGRWPIELIEAGGREVGPGREVGRSGGQEAG